MEGASTYPDLIWERQARNTLRPEEVGFRGISCCPRGGEEDASEPQGPGWGVGVLTLVSTHQTLPIPGT